MIIRPSLLTAVLAGMALGAVGMRLLFSACADPVSVSVERVVAAKGVISGGGAGLSASQYTLAQEIKKGGYILFFRHGQRQKWDSVMAFDVFEMATGVNSQEASFRDAVCLTAQGREEAKMLGKLFELAKVPVGAVAASPSCRARQTGELAFGKVDMISNALAHTPVTNSANAAQFSAELRRVLQTIPVVQDRNAVITAHGNTLENNRDMFAEGAEILGGTPPQETGFYVIKRNSNGTLRLVHKFLNLGEFAANAVDLKAVRQ